MPEIVSQPWMQVLLSLAFTLLCYLVGCTNGAILISKFKFKDDVRNHGSGNAGLTNFYRTYGPRYALLVVLVDVLKAALAVLLGALLCGWLLPGDPLLGKYWGGCSCVLGHIYPVTERFKGGKGILSSGTMLLFLGGKICLASWGIFVVMFLLTRYVSLGSVLAAVLFPIMTYLVYGDWLLVLLAVFTALLVIYGHRTNIKRLLTGTENKFKFHVNKVDDTQ